MKKNNTTKKVPKIKKARRDSLGHEACAVFLTNIICVLVLTPLYQTLGSLASGMAVDVEQEGGALHVLCDVGANVLFYIASFLGTAAFFAGAYYFIRAVYDGAWKRSIGASCILYFGMSVASIVTLLTYGVIKITDPSSISLSNPDALLLDVLFLLARVLLVYACALVCSRLGKPLFVCAVISCVIMFLCAVGLDIYDNIPFFMKGIILDVDVIKMIVSALLYAIHACLGYVVLMLFERKKKKQ